MDLYHFIDSHAIREHLQSLSYPFTTQEAAFLVWYCKTATLEEKHDAWHEIIDTMPNCSLEKLRRRGDTSDMFACGYAVQQENGRYGVRADGFPLCNYLELEYYEKPLTGFSQLQRPVGEYLKGACNIRFLLNQCILLLHQDQNHDA